MGIYDHNSVVIGLVSVEGNGKLSLAMAVVFVAGYFPAFYFMDFPVSSFSSECFFINPISLSTK